MLKINHLVYIPFTGLGRYNDGFIGQKWYEYREKIFKKYTLQSLSNQTNRNFTLWISFRPEEKDNPVTKLIEEDIKATGLKYILTFDGIAMWDDRGVWHNTDLEERLQRSVDVIKGQISPSEWIFKTDCGSDDMLTSEAIDEIQKEEPRDNGATYYLKGYVINDVTEKVADWNRKNSCSKYTVMFPWDVFFDAKQHMEYYCKKLKSHEYVPLVYDATRLPDNRYGAVIHEGNLGTIWDCPLKGDEYQGEEKNKILKKFGLT